MVIPAGQARNRGGRPEGGRGSPRRRGSAAGSRGKRRITRLRPRRRRGAAHSHGQSPQPHGQAAAPQGQPGQGRLADATARPARAARPGPEPGSGGPSLASRAGRAVSFSFVNSALARLSTVGLGILLARLLGPHEFAIYAIGYVALRVQINLGDLGTSLAIVRWPGPPRQIAPTVATVSLLTGTALYTGCYFAAPYYASALGAPTATGVVRVLCLAVIFDLTGAAPSGLLQRQFRQDLRLLTDQASVWLGAGLTTFLAWLGCGAMSLAFGRVAGSLIGLILLAGFSPEPLRFGFNPAVIRPLLRFSLPLAGSGILVFSIINVDQLAVGRLLGATALGFFVLASNLAGWPVTMFAQPVRNVAPAALARLQHDPVAMRRGFLAMAGLLAAVALPVCLSISGSAVPLIRFIYGARWLSAAPALGWLALLAALQIACELGYDYFVVLAKARVVFLLQLTWVLALLPALAVGAANHGITGMAIAEIAVAAGIALPWYLRELQLTGIGVRVLASRLKLPVLGAAVAGTCCLAASMLAPGDVAAFGCGSLAAGMVIAALLYRLRGDLDWLRRRPAEVAPAAAGVAPAAASVAPDLVRRTRAAAPADAPAPGTPAAGSPGPDSPAPDSPAPAAALAAAPAPGTPAALTAELAARYLTGSQPPHPSVFSSPGASALHAPAPDGGVPGELPRPARAGAAGPLPVFRDLLRVLPLPADYGPPPVYQQTVAALRWDPADGEEPGGT